MTIASQLDRSEFSKDRVTGSTIGETFFQTISGKLFQIDLPTERFDSYYLNEDKHEANRELTSEESTSNIRQLAVTRATLWLQELVKVQGKSVDEAREIVAKEICRAEELARMPEFTGITDRLYDAMEADAEAANLGGIPGLTQEDGQIADRMQFATDLMYVLLMDLRMRTGYGDIISLNHDAVTAICGKDIDASRLAVLRLIDHAEDNIIELNEGEFPLEIDDTHDNAYLIMSRAAAKAYCGFGTTLKGNAHAAYRIITGQSNIETKPTFTDIGADDHREMIKDNSKQAVAPIAETLPETNEVNIWAKRLAKLAVIGSGLFVWNEAVQANKKMMNGMESGCAVNLMVGAEKVTFYVGSLVYAYQLVNSTLAKIDASESYAELAKNTAFVPGVAVAVAVGKMFIK